MNNAFKLIGLAVLATLSSGCASSGGEDPNVMADRRTILTEGASQVLAEEGVESDNLICRKQRLPGSYRMIRICQSVEEYESEVAENRRLMDDWGSRGTACTSECGIGPEDGALGGGGNKADAAP